MDNYLEKSKINEQCLPNSTLEDLMCKKEDLKVLAHNIVEHLYIPGGELSKQDSQATNHEVKNRSILLYSIFKHLFYKVKGKEQTLMKNI